MPTQIPSGSPLVPTHPQRRKRAAGPRKLGYAGGGLVGSLMGESGDKGVGGIAEWEKKLDGRSNSPAAQPAPEDREKSDMLGTIAKTYLDAQIKSGGQVVKEEEPIGTFAAGGQVKRKRKFAGPRRLGYANGGPVKRSHTEAYEAHTRGAPKKEGAIKGVDGTLPKKDTEQKKLPMPTGGVRG